MASGLYEILRVDKEATLEQIKKAYRKQALQTHPDRLPQNATEEDRDRATEEFRKVNNAYEVLSDPSKREIYDRHGVWPAPEAIPGASPGPMPNGFHSHGFPDSFASQAHPHSHRHHVDPFFTDPFRLFELFFGSGSPFAHDLHGFATPMRDPFFNSSRAHPYDPLSAMGMLSGPAFTFGGNLFDNQAFGNFPGNTSSRVYSSSSRSTRTPGQNWVEESESISSCNGVTTSVKRRVDANGNTYETRTDASGVRRFTINGIDHDGSHPAFDNTSSRFNAVRSSSSRVPPQIPAPSAAPMVPDPSTRPEGHHRASRRSHSRRDSYQAAAPHPNLTMSRPVQATSPPPSYTPRAQPSFYPPHEATQRGDYDGGRQELRHPGYDAQYGGREPYSHQYEQPSRPGYNPQYEEPGRYDTHHEDHMRSGYGSRYDSQPRYGEPAGIPPYPPPETRNDHHRSRQSWLHKLIHRKPPRERMDIGL